MTKQEFIDRVADKSGLSRRDAAKAVDAYHEAITDSLTRGEAVTIPGFGKFYTSERKARTGVNPQNRSEKLSIPAATVPKFSAGSQLKAAVRR